MSLTSIAKGKLFYQNKLSVVMPLPKYDLMLKEEFLKSKNYVAIIKVFSLC